MNDRQQMLATYLARELERKVRVIELPYNFVRAIYEYLSEEPEPKHTQWVHEPDRINHWYCSVCGYVTGLAGLMGNFCPNCGAKVQKKTEEELRAEVSGGWMPALSFSQYVATAEG